MKRILLLSIAIFLFTVSNSQAQTSKGSWLVGGTGNFSYEKQDHNKVYEFSLDPSVSRFFADNLAIGLTLPLNYDKPVDYYHSIGFLLGPSVRYYFKFDKCAIFPIASYGIGTGKNVVHTDQYRAIHPDDQVDFGDLKTTFAQYKFQGGLGFTYFIKENLGVEAILAYENLSIDYGSGQAIALDEVEYSGVALNIGFQVYL